MKNKVSGIIGGIISIIFSTIGATISLIMVLAADSNSFVKNLTGDGATLADARQQAAQVHLIFVNILLFLLFYIVIAIIGLIFVATAKPSNTTSKGIVIIIVGALHIISLRLLSGVLMLVSGVSIVNDHTPPVQSQI